MSPAEGPAQQAHPAREIRATERAANLVESMTGRLGMWEDETDAALFLAALAVHQGRDPVPEADRGPAECTLGDLTEAVEGLDHVGELTLFKLICAPEEDLETVLAEKLPGLIEAGAEILGPRLSGARPPRATGALVDLLSPEP